MTTRNPTEAEKEAEKKKADLEKLEAQKRDDEIQSRTVNDLHHYHVSVDDHTDIYWTVVRQLGLGLVALLTMFLVMEIYVFNMTRFQMVKHIVDPKKVDADFWINNLRFSDPKRKNMFMDPYETDRFFATVTSVASRNQYENLADFDNKTLNEYKSCDPVYISEWSTIPKKLSSITREDLENPGQTDRRTFIERVMVVSFNRDEDWKEMKCPPTVLIIDHDLAYSVFTREQTKFIVPNSSTVGESVWIPKETTESIWNAKEAPDFIRRLRLSLLSAHYHPMAGPVLPVPSDEKVPSSETDTTTVPKSL